MYIIKERNASAFLVLNAVLWGSSYIWSKMLLGYLPYFAILLVFSLIGLLTLSIILFGRIRRIGRRTVITGVSIGCLSIMSNIFCMLALKGTSSSNTAFIVQLSVIITPLLMSAAKRKLPDRRTVLGAVAALAGLLLLTCNFRNFCFKLGDLFALCNAIFFSLYLTALKLYAENADPAEFALVQHIASTAAFLCLTLVFEPDKILFARINAAICGILALGAGISVATILIQASAIKYVRPEKATIIYTLEPVAAAALAFVIVGERLAGFGAFAGCLLIIFAVIGSAGAGTTVCMRLKSRARAMWWSLGRIRNVHAKAGGDYPYPHQIGGIGRKGA